MDDVRDRLQDGLRAIDLDVEGALIAVHTTARRRAHRRRAGVIGLALASCVIAGAFLFSVFYGSAPSGPSIMPGAPPDRLADPTTCANRPCTVFRSFPVGSLSACPTDVSPVGGFGRGALAAGKRAAASGSWPWDAAHPATQALFASESDYTERLDGKPFDFSVMSIPQRVTPAVQALVESTCGRELAAASRDLVMTVRRGGDETSLDLVFVGTRAGPRLWLALPAASELSERAQGDLAEAQRQNTRGTLPSGREIGVLFGFPEQEVRGCSDFVEYDEPRGFCMDGWSGGGGSREAALLAAGISGRTLTSQEVGILEEMVALQRLRASSGASAEAAELEREISREVDAWWELNYGKSADDDVPAYGPCGT